jgi:orotate phosphoribosyltransferase
MSGAEVLDLLRSRGAVRSGHFLLSSGRHSDTYVEKARVFEDARATAAMGERIAAWYPDVQAVVSPAVGALPLGFAVAVAAGARFLYAEREQGRMTFRRGFALGPEERTVVVEDVITTGGSAAEVFRLVASMGAEPLGVAALVDRSAAPLPFPLRALCSVRAESWTEDSCPLCARGMVVESPGSRHLDQTRRSHG